MATPTIATAWPVIRHIPVAEGLRNAAIFIERHRDLPLGAGSDPLHVSVQEGSDEDSRAEVDRIAKILGVTAGDRLGGGTHYEARRDFGGGVTYRAVAINSTEMDRWNAHMSRFRQPEGAAA